MAKGQDANALATMSNTTTDQKPVVYYLTEDVFNKKEIDEIQLLCSVARVVLVTPQACPKNSLGLHQVRVAPMSARAERLYNLWSRVCFMLCQLAPSAGDINFPRRNIYQTSATAKAIVNALWRFKQIAVFNRCLPRYDTLYFLPAHLASMSQGTGRHSARRKVFVHDALLVRMNKFAPFLASARAQGHSTLCSVKSWDNPFYSQLATNCDGYLLWSQAMAEDIRCTHPKGPRSFMAWGARPFQSIVNEAKHSPAAHSNGSRSHFTLGYAAAFCDPIMADHEVGAIAAIAEELSRRSPTTRLLFRPYPTLPLSLYARLDVLSNVQIMDIAGPATDRFGDGRETIKFGSDQERLQFLGRCDAFLSLATSFTIEAAIAGTPVVHLHKEPLACTTSDERAIFGRIDVSDHLLKYYKGGLNLAQSGEQLAEWIDRIKTGRFDPTPQQTLLSRMGVTPELLAHEASTSLQPAIKQFIVGHAR
jgi:hypothetical protein